MLKLKRINLKKTISFFKKLPRILAKRAFLAFLILFSLSLILSGLIYWRQSTFIKKAQPESVGGQLKFRSKTYQSVLTIWQQKEDRFKQVDSKAYPNLFIP